eukprot:7813282-Pyramimonas_sp.AAC.1
MLQKDDDGEGNNVGTIHSRSEQRPDDILNARANSIALHVAQVNSLAPGGSTDEHTPTICRAKPG